MIFKQKHTQTFCSSQSKPQNSLLGGFISPKTARFDNLEVNYLQILQLQILLNITTERVFTIFWYHTCAIILNSLRIAMPLIVRFEVSASIR